MILTIPPHDENDAIRQPAVPVTIAYLQQPETQLLIDNMIETMRNAKGVGLAAPQIGQSIQIAVIETLPDYDNDGNEIEETRDLYVIVNPEVSWASQKEVLGIEGCLSIMGYVGEVCRPHSIHVWAMDRHGQRKRYRLKGWDARIFLHEIDHLHGILYTDKLSDSSHYWTEEAYEAYIESTSPEEEMEQ